MPLSPYSYNRIIVLGLLLNSCFNNHCSTSLPRDPNIVYFRFRDSWSPAGKKGRNLLSWSSLCSSPGVLGCSFCRPHYISYAQHSLIFQSSDRIDNQSVFLLIVLTLSSNRHHSNKSLPTIECFTFYLDL